MPGKIERPTTNAARPAVERAQVETPTKSAAVSRAPVAKNAFSAEGGPSTLGSGSAGTHVARSARPDALWGSGEEQRDRRINLDPHQFDKLTPGQRTERLEALKTQRDGLQVKILARVIELERKWDRAPTAIKEDALREYAETSEQLDPETRQELRQLVRQAEIAERRIDRLQSRRDDMPPARHANAETKRLRAELNKELRAARKEQKEAVKEATAVVDDKGLKIDRLAETEQVIDPSAPKKEGGSSLLGMVKDFFKFSWLTSWLMTKIVDLDDRGSIKASHEAQLQRELADHQAHQKQVENREAIKKLTTALELTKR